MPYFSRRNQSALPPGSTPPNSADPNATLAWLSGPGYGLPMDQWNALHNLAIRAQATGSAMPMGGDALKNLQAAVGVQNQGLAGQRTGQEIGQSAMSFPLQMAQRQQELTNSYLTAQKTGQEINQSAASFPMQQQQRQQEIMNGGITATTGIDNQLQTLVKGYGGMPGDLLAPGSLARRNLVFDTKTGAYRAPAAGETPDMTNTLSFYIPPRMEAPDPNNPSAQKFIPGTYRSIDDQGAQAALDLANRRNAMIQGQGQGMPMGMQGGAMGQQAQQQATPSQPNTGWGIFGNYGQVGSPGQAGFYQTNYLPDEANSAGMSQQAYLQAIAAKQQAQQQPVAQLGARPSGYTPYQMPQSPQAEFAALHQQRSADMQPGQQSDASAAPWAGAAMSMAPASAWAGSGMSGTDLNLQPIPDSQYQPYATPPGGITNTARSATPDMAGAAYGQRQDLMRFLSNPQGVVSAGNRAGAALGNVLQSPISFPVNTFAGWLGQQQNVVPDITPQTYQGSWINQLGRALIPVPGMMGNSPPSQ